MELRLMNLHYPQSHAISNPAAKHEDEHFVIPPSYFNIRSFMAANNEASRPPADRTKDDESIKALRDIIAFCTIPPRPVDGAKGLWGGI